MNPVDAISGGSMLGVPVIRPKTFEATAQGAGYLAGLAVGYWKSSSELADQWQVDRTFEPSMPRSQVADMRGQWHKCGAGKKWVD